MYKITTDINGIKIETSTDLNSYELNSVIQKAKEMVLKKHIEKLSNYIEEDDEVLTFKI